MQAQYKFSDENKFHEWLQQQFGESYEELRDQKKRDLTGAEGDFLSSGLAHYRSGSRTAEIL